MKKMRLFTIIVSLLVLLAFSGCDAILEAFYPEFTAGGAAGGGENGISVWVEIQLPAEGLPADVDPKIGGILLNLNNDVFDEVFMYPEWNWDDAAATWSLSTNIDFYGVAGDEEYQVLVWLELNDDYEPNWGEEPQAFAEWVTWDDANKADIPMGPRFPFPNDEGLTWLNGGAFVPFFSGGAAFDPVFKLKGEFTVHSPSPSVEVYTVKPRDGTRMIQEFAADIYTSSGTWITREYDTSVNAASTKFSFNYGAIDELGPGALPEDDYFLEVWVLYQDGTEFFRAYPLRVLKEAALSTSYNLNVYLEGLDGWPHEIPKDVNYFVEATIFSPDGLGNLVPGEVKENHVFYSSSAFNLPVEASLFPNLSSLSYNPSKNSGSSSTPTDWIRIRVDISGTADVIDGADLELMWPISLSTTEAGGLKMYAGSWDMVPLPPPTP